MKLKECSPKLLSDGSERAQAKLARIARWDCINGGARALVLAKRMTRAQFDAYAVVSSAYTAYDGYATDYLAYECPECGCPVIGSDNALGHCSLTDEG